MLSLELEGLDSWSAFKYAIFKSQLTKHRLLEPLDNYTLSSFTAMDELNANVTFFVNVTANGLAHAGDSLYEKVFEMQQCID